MIQKIDRDANVKSKVIRPNEDVFRVPYSPNPLKVDSKPKEIIICCLPMPPHVPFFISGDIGKLLGYVPEDIIGNTNFWVNTVHMADVPQLFTGFYHMFIRGNHVYEYKFLSKEGTYKQLVVQIFLHRQQKGKPATVMACLRESIIDTWETHYGTKGTDCQDQNLLELTVDCNNRILQISPQVEKLLGYSPKKLIGKSPLDFIPPDYVFTSREVHIKIINQKHDFIRFWNAVKHQDGSLRFLMNDCTGYVNNRKERSIKIRSRDITHHVALDATKRVHYEQQLLSSLSRGEATAQLEMGEHPLEKLSAREREILYLTVEGFSSTRIGDRLTISSRTVEAHRANLMKKLNASSINQLVRYMAFHMYSSQTA